MRHAFVICLALAACAEFEQAEPEPAAIETDAAVAEALGIEVEETEEAVAEDVADLAMAPPPPSDAQTIEEFDTTTEEQRAEAVAVFDGGELLGETVASLGDVGTPGFWIETSFVTQVMNGRIRNPENGIEVAVQLRPLERGSSRLSLGAMRLIEAPLTELVTIEVYRNQ